MWFEKTGAGENIFKMRYSGLLSENYSADGRTLILKITDFDGNKYYFTKKIEAQDCSRLLPIYK